MPRLRSITGGAEPTPDSPRDLWRELAAATSPEGFAAPYLVLQCRRIPEVRQALLVLGPPDRGPFEVAATWPEAGLPAAALLEGAERALRGRKPLIAGARAPEPAPVGPVADPPPDPSIDRGSGVLEARSLVAVPLEAGERLLGAIVVQLPARPEPELRELAEELRWGAGWLEALHRRTGGRGGRSRKARIELVPSLLASVLDHEDFDGAARTFATELATELGCERVSVGFLRRGRVRLSASSHAAHASERTNLVRSIEAAMEEALDQRAALAHPAEPERSRVTQAQVELSKQHGSAAVCSVPIVYAGQGCGALTLERDAERPFDEATLRALEVVADLVGTVLEVMRREQRGPATRLALDVRDGTRRLLGPRHVAAKLIAAGIAFLLIFFAFARGEYRITADVVLEPAVMRAAAAPFDGYVGESWVRAGDLVKAGDRLAALDTRDLRLEQIRWQSQFDQLEKQRRQALATREASQVEILGASLEEARAELVRIQERLERALLVAPFDAIVITGDLTQQLGAPVEKGAVLFEVAPLDDYRMILKVDETDVADVVRGQTGRVVFSSLPDEPVSFTVEKLTPVALAEEGRNYFRVEGRLATADTRLRPAIEGVAKIEVERRRLLWIWTHDLVDWLRVAAWRWLP